MATLGTERLILRPFVPGDLDDLVALDADPEVMRYINGGRPTTREEIETEILPAFLTYHDRTDGYGFWAAVERASGDVLGWFHLRPHAGAPTDAPELGYRLRASAWGRGLATEGSRELVRHGFEDLGARRIYAEAMAVHAASRRVLEKAGLRHVRTFHQPWPDRIEGDELGDVEYAISREGWERDRAQRGGAGPT